MPIEVKIKNLSFLVPESNDPCEVWVAYFNSLKKSVGITNARMLWMLTWKSNGASTCTTNGDFNTWLKKNSIDVSSAATRAIADVTEIGSNFMGMSKNLSKVASVAIPATLLLILASIGVILWNTSKKVDVADIAMLTPVGRSISLGTNVVSK
ncbi:hypothetical protein [Aquimarina pacifica]|uniref:hypothetical protein n=1 Tax=Aquimarina pacifica TaxID=1296415 RepID=UPI000471706F|nr:hypothetical protein [Aquimarina pacifica]